MPRAFTRVTLLVPGTPSLAKGWKPAVPRKGVTAEWFENDGAFGEAFSFGTVAPEKVAEIEAAAGALVLEWQVDLREGREEIVETVAKLREKGGLAVRLEESKVGWEIGRWLELFAPYTPWSWHRGAVVMLSGDGALQSCGMHAFSLPDVRVPLDASAEEIQELATVFDLYQLAEDPVIRSGQTFAPDERTPHRVVERWPDDGYPPEHPCHNPYGVWRMSAPGAAARALPKLELVFMPALRALLGSLEETRGAPLTQAQVEEARDAAACIAMEPRDAQKLERGRGYADLDPRLAWEQWRIVRAATSP